MSRWKFRAAFIFPSVVLLLVLAGCNNTRVLLAQAYVAPITLHLHSEISTKSSVLTDLKHGDHLEIVDVQRRMVRVRTDRGQEGWVDAAQLLSPEQMDALKLRRAQEAALPPEGTATAYEALNIHVEADRQSATFAQIPEGGAVTVIGHKVLPRVIIAARTPGLSISRPQSLAHKKGKEQKSGTGAFRLPPKPEPPKPPANWLALSAERIDGGESQEPSKPTPAPVVAAKPKAKAEPKPIPMDDWTLVRTKNNEIGWVLTRNLLMSIPDEVAQYAEGKNITAFFDVGSVKDEAKGPKHDWLWATSSRGLPYDFDSWRVFLWNIRKHRYETSFRQHDLEGYFPIRVDAADSASADRRFHIITKDDDGQLRSRTYSFDGHLVHLADTEDYNPAAESAKEAAALNTKDLAAKVKPPNWFRRQLNSLKRNMLGN